MVRDSRRLQEKAESFLRKTRTDVEGMSAEDVQELVHELQLHQVELHMQNEELRRFQGELEAAKEKYSRLFEFAPVGYAVIDANETIREANLTLASMLGVERASLVGVKFVLQVARPDRDLFYYFYQDALRKRAAASCDLRLAMSSWGVFDARLEMGPIEKDAQGEPLCRIAVSDITKEKDAQRELQKSNETLNERVEERALELERSYRNLAEVRFAVDQGAIVETVDSNGKILYVNDKFCEISKYRSEEVIGQDHRLVRSGYHPVEFFEGLWRTILAGEIWRGEVCNRAKDGSTYWVDTTIVPIGDAHGRPERFMSIRFDITDRKRVEEELWRERDFDQRLWETAQAILLVVDTEGRIVRFNPYFERLGGYRLEEVEGRGWFETFLPERDQQRIRELFSQVIGGTCAIESVNPIITREGEERLIEWNASPIKDPEGRITGLLSVGQDITEREAAERKLREQEALVKLGELAAVMAHEIKNPMAGIRGAVRVLQDEMEPGSANHQVAHEIIERIDSLNGTLREILQFARPQAPTLQAVPVKIVIESVVEQFFQDPARANVEVRVDGTEATCVGDPDMLRSVVLNLLLNAGDAMGDQGQVNLSVDRVREGEEERCRLRVADTGPGIPEELRERLFEPFVTTKHKGTGLGLATAKRLVELQGGSIAAECPPEEGTVFTLDLPLAQ